MLSSIGNTPMVKLNKDTLFAKIEGANPFGSMKDRAAAFVIQQLWNQKTIDKETEIIESSSGNFGIALAAVCSIYGLKFTCVTDPMISPANKELLKLYGASIIFASQRDENGSFLSNRLSIIKRMLRNNNNTYWINQYNNELMIKAYETSLAEEILSEKPDVAHVFIPVSTCGCIAGLSRRLKSYNEKIHIIAVDIEGSCIFHHSSHIRHIPGMGAPITPQNLEYAYIDDVVIVSEFECVTECRKLVKQGILSGASSGGTIAAVKKAFAKEKSPIVAIFPDRGDRYLDTVYNDDWCKRNINGFARYLTDNLGLSIK